MWIDHITLAGPDLPALREDLLAAGIPTEYGGVHSNGITHMALAGFRDGSYLELVSPLQPSGRVALWSDYLLPQSGGTAWTAASADIKADFRAARDLGIPSKGPVTIRREKPNGEHGAWELGYYGDKQPGGTLPFLIQDRTPRSIRVEPGKETGKTLSGWTAVVLAVHDAAAAADDFMWLYGWGQPEVLNGLVHFPGTPVYLASPEEHLRRFGESPCAVILGVLDEEHRFHTRGTSEIGGKTIRWLDLHTSDLQIGLETSQGALLM
jgi:hypothetical protein